MPKRFVSIWFHHLVTDWLLIRRPVLREIPFVMATPEKGRMVITAASRIAEAASIDKGMVVADARALVASLQVFDHQAGRAERLLKALAEWSMRYTPLAAIDPPDGLILDVSGCPHLWGGERPYLSDITTHLKNAGYGTRVAMADTIGCAWAIARFGQVQSIIENGKQAGALCPLPPAALRLPPDLPTRLHKQGLSKIVHFMNMPRAALRRRFGPELLYKLDQAMGLEEETMKPVQPVAPYQERLPCLEPMVTATGIEIALQRLLDALCCRLQQEEKGLRAASFKGYRLDGKTVQIEIGTHCPSCNARHLFKLFEPRIAGMEPGPGIELFMLEASKLETVPAAQHILWAGSGGLTTTGLSELLDRLANRVGSQTIHRYLPDEHYWPERSLRATTTLHEKPALTWQTERPRPTRLLVNPAHIEVTAPVPDYPPMLFRYQGNLHTIKKADGPERIEAEWWLEEGPHRDYYQVEDEEGRRYWLFRLGHYTAGKPHQWFIHGFFA
ncbi:MAG: DNA polymerase Y family protein [Bacteroidota bacterium]